MDDITTVWSRIEGHAREGHRLVRGNIFQYEAPDNYLRPLDRISQLSQTNFAKALDRLPPENT